MNWRAFLQRIAFLAFVAILVLVLIEMELGANLALSIAGGIVLTAKDLWLSVGESHNAPAVTTAAAPPSLEHPPVRGVFVRQLAVSSKELCELQEPVEEYERSSRNEAEGI
ncbi:hypothetical protein OG824_09530 [Streptomyces prunicolor]|uniref:hypothetical protein n=1 Tax=Streptomyces prunicolor TaxID=67348 RepID=UPI00224F079F|nr:hypothetical protein [Streptomyces prunicolor]MCX5235461.1 hypothetical protein [Streptomyces prunicolor]